MSCAEAGEEHLLRAIWRNEKDVRRSSHNDAVTPGQDARGIAQIIHDHRTLVIASVRIAVFEHHHTPSSLAVAIHAQRVVRHLNHPQPSFIIPVKRHRIKHHRLRRDEFDAVALAHMPLLRRFLGGERGRSGLQLRRHGRLHAAGLVMRCCFIGGEGVIIKSHLVDFAFEVEQVVAAPADEPLIFGRVGDVQITFNLRLAVQKHLQPFPRAVQHDMMPLLERQFGFA